MDDKIHQELQKIWQAINQQNLLKKDLLDLKEAAEYLNISVSHLYKLTSRKEVPHYCPKGKKLYFRRSELNEWLTQNKVASKEQIEKNSSNYLITKDTKQ